MSKKIGPRLQRGPRIRIMQPRARLYEYPREMQNGFEISSFFPLSAPDFVNALEDEDHVYFFFREAAVEFINCGKVSGS